MYDPLARLYSVWGVQVLVQDLVLTVGRLSEDSAHVGAIGCRVLRRRGACGMWRRKCFFGAPTAVHRCCGY